MDGHPFLVNMRIWCLEILVTPTSLKKGVTNMRT